MNEFDFDVMQKKRLSASARHKVNGSKSRKCGLPSDHMTPAQIKKLNGPCESYDLGKPMTWDDFKAMPIDLRQQYLDGLHSRFRVGAQTISVDLFGLSTSALGFHIKRNNMRSIACKGERGGAKDRAAWESWLNPVVDAPVIEETIEECDEPLVPDVLLEPIPYVPVPLKEEEPLQVSDLTATFTGKFEPERFLKWVAMLPVPEGKVKIRLEVTSA